MSREETEKPFRFLTTEEFEQLSQNDKVSYLARAVHQLSVQFPYPQTPAPKRSDPDESTQEQP